MYSLVWLLLLGGSCRAGLYSDVWYLEHTVASPDGYPRDVIGVYKKTDLDKNVSVRPFPGPVVRVQKGDQVQIIVYNNLRETTSMHWHGLSMFNQVWMDGVEHITQPGIRPGGSMNYSFVVDQDPGTHWYHAHSNLQFGDGLFGPFIIDPPTSQSATTAKDYVMMVQDWQYESGNLLVGKYLSKIGAYEGFVPDYPWPPNSVLINGKGQSKCEYMTEEDCIIVRNMGWSWYKANASTLPLPPQATNPSYNGTKGQCQPVRPPYMGTCRKNADPEYFQCPQGKTIRIRLINSGVGIPLRFWVDRHPVTVIARDGEDIQPNGPHNFVLIPLGQRLDLLLTCNHSSGGSFKVLSSLAWEYYPGSKTKSPPAPSVYAVLHYAADPKQDPVIDPEYPVEYFPNNTIASSIGNSTTMYLPMYDFFMKPKVPIVTPAVSEPSIVWHVTSNGNWWNHGVLNNNNHLEWWETNGHVFSHSLSEPLLPWLYRGHKLSELTNDPGLIQPLIFDKANPRWYEIVIVNYEGQQHPWHIHGHTAHLVGYGYFSNTTYTKFTTQLGTPETFVGGKFVYDAAHHRLPYWNQSLSSAVLGDTFTVPPNGFVVLRIRAANPGAWLVHCHMEFHMAVGMSALLLVQSASNNITADLPAPPANELDAHSTTTNTVPTKINHATAAALGFQVTVVLVFLSVLLQY